MYFATIRLPNSTCQNWECACVDEVACSERTSHSSIGYKRQKRLQRISQNEVIPIQLVTGYHSRNNCVVTANSMSSIIMCNELRNVLPAVRFLDFIMKSVDCPQSVKESMKCTEAQEDRNISLGKEPSGAKKRSV